MQSVVKKRSVHLHGRKTSVSMEDEFWEAFKEIARERGKYIIELIAEVDSSRVTANLSSALRLFVLDHYQSLTSARLKVQQPGLTPDQEMRQD